MDKRGKRKERGKTFKEGFLHVLSRKGKKKKPKTLHSEEIGSLNSRGGGKGEKILESKKEKSRGGKTEYSIPEYQKTSNLKVPHPQRLKTARGGEENTTCPLPNKEASKNRPRLREKS